MLPATMSRWLTTSMGTTTDCVSKEAKAPPAKFDIADAADAVGANLLAGSAAQVFVISRVVKYICMKFANVKQCCLKLVDYIMKTLFIC